mmetsp:Transcript_37580/g.39026  ORF Transcript_37580/g.39026 Transcript_37580/m.39026 type:complete len:220 (+) Transcript_37580:171-830(+)
MSSALGIEGIIIDQFPMIEHTLREGLSGSLGSKVSSKTERLGDWEISFNIQHGGTRNRLFTENNSSSLVEALVDSSHHILRSGNIDKEDRLNKSRRSGVLTGKVDSSGSSNDLVSSSVDGIGVKLNVQNVVSGSSHSFFSNNSFFGSPLEGTNHRILDFVKVLNSLGGVNYNVRSNILRSESPDFLGFLLIPSVLILKTLGDLLDVFIGGEGSGFNILN